MKVFRGNMMISEFRNNFACSYDVISDGLMFD